MIHLIKKIFSSPKKDEIPHIEYKLWFGNTLEQLLNNNEIDKALEIIKTNNVFNNDEYFRSILLKHVETYKYSC